MKSQIDKDLTRDYGVAFCHLCLQGKEFYHLKLYIYYHTTMEMLPFLFISGYNTGRDPIGQQSHF